VVLHDDRKLTCSAVTSSGCQSLAEWFLHPTPAHHCAVAASPGAASDSIKYRHDKADGIKQPPGNGWFLPVRALRVPVVPVVETGGVLEGQAQAITVRMETGVGDPYVRRGSAKERVRWPIRLVRG